MAFTGIAATLLPKSMTVHKVFGSPVPLLPDDRIMNNNFPFVGKVVVLGGDFRNYYLH
jgi:hypothetical protein